MTLRWGGKIDVRYDSDLDYTSSETTYIALSIAIQINHIEESFYNDKEKKEEKSEIEVIITEYGLLKY
ncbi:jg19037 [Pararge aegeria aegeria]|uniref:Jg19037 protein n=1 Tax=Pararge aegeria aegeria TaxID=348720 RepID=A0A8S4R817_9NEOP|nr:jg19037 [Pararge aegeria aegeria]